MIKGMTGFGSIQYVKGKIKASVEIKTLNHKYFDINYYLPLGFGCIEHKVKKIINSKIQRGRITVIIKIIQKETEEISFNENMVDKYLEQANRLERKCGLENDLTISSLINLPGIVEKKVNFITAEDIWPSLEKSVNSALLSVLKMRTREGRSITLDITQKLKEMNLEIKKIKQRSKQLFDEKKKQLTEEELKSFQKGSDINEELSRLAHYILEAKLLLKATSPVGKKIDFVGQEMQRETNTIGSKLQDKVVSSSIFSLKSKIEKIREQAPNIE